MMNIKNMSYTISRECSGRSNILDFEEVVKLDLKYIEEWSLRLDIKIIFRTILVVLKREGSK